MWQVILGRIFSGGSMDTKTKLLSLPDNKTRGEPCGACGGDIIYKSSGCCVQCNIYRRNKVKANPEFTEKRRRVEDLEPDYYDSLMD